MARGLRFRVDKHHVYLEKLLLAAGVVLPRVLEALLLHEGLDLGRRMLPCEESGRPLRFGLTLNLSDLLEVRPRLPALLITSKS
jgi:hypothetical protein